MRVFRTTTDGALARLGLAWWCLLLLDPSPTRVSLGDVHLWVSPTLFTGVLVVLALRRLAATTPPNLPQWRLMPVVQMSYASYLVLWAAALTTGPKSVIGVAVYLVSIATMDAYARSLRGWAATGHISTVLAAWRKAARLVRLTLVLSVGAALGVWLARLLRGVRHAGWTAALVIPAMCLLLVSLIATWQAQASTRTWAVRHAFDPAAV
jgi:hypothetical protein